MAKAPANRASRRASASKRPTPPENPHRGQAKVEVDGDEFVFCIKIGGLSRLAQAWGSANNQALFARLQGELIKVGVHPETNEDLFAPAGPAMQDVPLIAEALTDGALIASRVADLGIAELEPIMRGITLAVARAYPEKKRAPSDAADAANPETPSPSTNGPDSPGV